MIETSVQTLDLDSIVFKNLVSLIFVKTQTFSSALFYLFIFFVAMTGHCKSLWMHSYAVVMLVTSSPWARPLNHHLVSTPAAPKKIKKSIKEF